MIEKTDAEALREQVLAQAKEIERKDKALRNVQAIVAAGAISGFNCYDGDWADQLFASQRVTAAALSPAAQEADHIADAQTRAWPNKAALWYAQHYQEAMARYEALEADLAQARAAAIEEAAKVAERDADWSAFGKRDVEQDVSREAIRDYRIGIISGSVIAAAIRALASRPATPPGYEPYTPATVQAIRETCSTPASRTPKQET